MKDYISSCSYNQLYQNVKQVSKDGEYFCKELMNIMQQRSELDHTYAKGLQKLAGKLMRASKGMTNNSVYGAWCQVSDEMYSRADAHRSLANAFQQEAILELRQLLDEHNKRKRPLDNAIERTGKHVTVNWTEQIKTKKKLVGLTREHEALFNFVESNKHLSTEKEKQKMLNRLTKSAEVTTRVDEEYFNANMEGQQMRLKWENTLKNGYQVVQELEKQRIEVLCNMLTQYKLHMSSFGQTLKHSQKQIELLVQRVDMDKDIQKLVEENNVTTDNKAKFLMTDYFEEDSKSLMCRDRRREAIKLKLCRLEDAILKAKKDCEGIQKLMKIYSENPSFSNQRNLEETEQQLDENTLKLDLLEATHYKLSASLCDLEGKPRSSHRFKDSIVKWKDKDCEHSVVQLIRPVKLRRTFRTRHSLRASIIYKGPVRTTKSPTEESACGGTAPLQEPEDRVQSPTLAQEPNEHGRASIGIKCLFRTLLKSFAKYIKHSVQRTPDVCTVGQCKALYSFAPQQSDELPLKEGTEGNKVSKPFQKGRSELLCTLTCVDRGPSRHLHKGREWLVVWSAQWPDGSFSLNICRGAACAE
ncbi:nostrin isoform X1 [Syngnathus scovelli]|uniref:nostrin isoform X1 n=1 Tax=Syngnathus scovelli TaxID=161590 RepID=UPI002110A999|nr:nostrin isoform X1 [Syngnathus scovelli]